MTFAAMIERATDQDAEDISAMVCALLTEIMSSTGVQAFNPDAADTTARCADFIRQEKYFAFISRASDKPAGFITLYECHSLYAGGTFGTIAEFYVSPEFRSKNIGHRLIKQARSFGFARGWRRLEVTTPPLPHFERTLAFYERQGFSITGGRKLALAF